METEAALAEDRRVVVAAGAGAALAAAASVAPREAAHTWPFTTSGTRPAKCGWAGSAKKGRGKATVCRGNKYLSLYREQNWYFFPAEGLWVLPSADTATMVQVARDGN